MIVNSSQGGGSKDTWVLDDGSATDLAPGTLPTHRPPRLPDVRYGGWHGQAQQQQQQSRAPGAADARPDRPGAVLARPRPDARRAHRADARRRVSRRRRRACRASAGSRSAGRACSRSSAPSRPSTARRATAGSRSTGRRGARRASRSEPARARRGRPAADARHRQPRLDRLVRRPRARARRTLRDVISTEMWEALNSFYLVARPLRPPAALPTGPYSRLPGGQGALRAVLGTRRPHDAARRGPRVPRGRRPHRGGRHGAADAARRAPAQDRSTRRAPTPATRARRSRCCRPSAAFRPTAARPASAPSLRLGRAVPALRGRLPGLGRLLGRGAARRAVGRRRAAALLPAGAAARAADRRPRAPAPHARTRRRRSTRCSPGYRMSSSSSIKMSTSATSRSPPWPRSICRRRHDAAYRA